jgi:hypothetical protein
MKKSLVALAVLAASGASFAQVSVSGGLGFSYQKNAAVAGGAANHGMQMADGNLNFSATEDLGAGMKITAASAFVSRGRDTPITARDASLTLATGSGSLVLGAVEQCSRIDNVAGAPVSLASAQDGTNAPLYTRAYIADGSCNTADVAGFSTNLGPVAVGLSYSEIRDYAAPAGGNATDTSAVTLSADYASGAFSAGLDYSMFKAGGGGAAFAAATYHDGLARVRASASYDLGVAKIGGGIETANHNSATMYTLSVAAPVGSAVTVGLIYANRASQTADTVYYGANVEARSATAIGVNYALGKMTTLNASYGTYSNSAELSNEYRIRLLKSF